MLQKLIYKILEEVSRHPKSSTEGQSDLETFVVSSPAGDSEAGRGEDIMKYFELRSVKV